MSGDGKQAKPNQREGHANGQRIGHGALVGIGADHGLQQRSGNLERQRQKADLLEVQTVILLEHRVDGRKQRLHHVIEKMAEADCKNDGKDGCFSGSPLSGQGGVGHQAFPS